MIRESKYIIRRVIVGVLIALILSFINSCEVHAETYNINTDNVVFNLWKNGNFTKTGTSDTLYWEYDITNYYGFTQTITLEGLLPDGSPNILFPGQYLIEFYVYATNSTQFTTSCTNLTSNFTNVNKTTGNWVSNEIKSQCVDLYRTTYNGYNAYRILYKFNYTGATTGSDGIDEIKFNITSSPNDFFGSGNGMDFGLSSSNIYDYDSSLVSQFNDYKQNQTIISQNNVITSALDGMIDRQNQTNNKLDENKQAIENGTNDIIDNQNQNTQDVIDNQNANTDKEIESQQVCKNLDISYYKNIGALTSLGDFNSSNLYKHTDYLTINKNDTIKLIKKETGNLYFCFYDINKDFISCYSNYDIQEGDTLNIPNNSAYFRATIKIETVKPVWQICKNGNQAMNDSINETNDTLKDNTVDDPSGEFEDFKGMLAENGVITELITLPISLFTNILNSINGTCSAFVLGELMGTNLTIPCINISEFLGSFLWNVIDILFSGIFVYTISKKMIQVFENMTSMRESDDLA